MQRERGREREERVVSARCGVAGVDFLPAAITLDHEPVVVNVATDAASGVVAIVLLLFLPPHSPTPVSC